MSYKHDLKGYIASSGYTLTKLTEELNKRNESNYSVQNLSNKIRKESLKYDEILQIADILGYSIIWQKHRKLFKNK